VTTLQRAIEAARTAILARAGVTPNPNRVEGLSLVPLEQPCEESCHTFDAVYETHLMVNITAKSRLHQRQLQRLRVEAPQGAHLTDPPRPLVRVSRPTQPPQAPSWPSCEVVSAGAVLSAGAGRVWSLLHGLAVEVAQARAYATVPDAVTFHLPAGLLALGLGYSARHVRRLLPELVAAGLLAHGAHASKVNGMSLWDGCLWSVAVAPRGAPWLRRDEWRHSWRDFAADIEAGRTVKALLDGMSHLHPEERGKAVGTALKAWAVTPGNLNSPVACSADMTGTDTLNSVQDVVYTLPLLAEAHPAKRAQLVGLLASALAHALDDRHSRRWYCSLIWNAWAAEVEGRRGLGVLAAQLARLDADTREWVDLRRPAALLAARLTG
jgi:hypothetical protein